MRLGSDCHTMYSQSFYLIENKVVLHCVSVGIIFIFIDINIVIQTKPNQKTVDNGCFFYKEWFNTN